jgi:hypothetical protein
MVNDDEVILGCVRVADAGVVALDSVQRDCGDCGAALWVAPSGVEILEQPGAIPVCGECMSRRMHAKPEPFEPISARQVAEVAATMAHLRRRN